MKKLVSLLLVFFLFQACASAVMPDLSGLTYDELVQLKSMINLEIWQREEWQEVTVPQGVWIVGEDIPAGTWTVKCAEYVGFSSIEWGDRMGDNGHSISWFGKYRDDEDLVGNLYKTEFPSFPLTYTFTARDGDYVVISLGDMIFMPFHGKPDLGFK